jgi:hypothetical protein
MGDAASFMQTGVFGWLENSIPGSLFTQFALQIKHLCV